MSWERIAARLRAELGEDLYSSWFARMEAEECQGRQLAVSVPTRFLKNWIEAHYAERLQKISELEFGALETVSIRVRTRGGVPRPPEPIVREPAEPAMQPARASETRSSAFPSHSAQLSGERGSPLDPGLTFASFLLGSSNALAHAAAMRIADAEAGQALSFNPLFIHSAAGLGKTHLLNAISWRIREQNPGRKVLFITAERFMYHFLSALRARDVISFKDFFQSIDVLLIDDFQFLQGKTMQQEFCHTFNSLVDAKRQVVIAADVPPSQLESIDQRMRSRLAGGLVVDVTAPDHDLRRAIIETRLAETRRRDPSIMIGADVAEFVAGRITGGGREIEGALNRIIASQQLTRSPITVDMAALALRDLTQPATDGARIRIEDILKVVGRHYNVARTDLLSPRRARTIVRPRQVGMYLAKKLTPRSLPEIGRRFGGRDHSTVLHAVRKIEDMLKTDDKLAREIQLLTRLVEQQPATP